MQVNDKNMANALRFLAMDAVEQAKSGHPGAPMGMAEIALVLWTRYLRHNPANPGWANRDRFVLSNGHASMLIYALLHLSGYKLDMEALRNFRQLHSGTPGHPEVDITPGIEATTGPLGQGLGNAVGMALAEQLLASEFNRDGQAIIDHYTYVLVGDGCLMEGISHESCSLAGTLGLGKLIVLYDDNGISIDGNVDGWFRDDTPARFAAYGWQVVADVDGHDTKAIATAIDRARGNTAQPSLICCKTIIGRGAPTKAGGGGVHGAPLGSEEIAAARQQQGWDAPPFDIPASIASAWDARQRGSQLEQEWDQAMTAYANAHPQLASELQRRMAGKLSPRLAQRIGDLAKQATADASPVATRKASQNALSMLAPLVPELLGGSADLTGSNLTNFSGSTQLEPGKWGNHISWGVREFGMAAALNGVALHCGYIPYGGTFLTFSDYCRNAIRMAALMHRRVIYVFSHDSIGLGEDGPTHQSIEHLPALRLIPNLDVWRPADSLETLAAWYAAITHASGPSALVLSRQGLTSLHTDAHQWQDVLRGGYILSDCNKPSAVIIATGSELGLAMEAQHQLAGQGVGVRVVSMPCTQVFDRQEQDYQASVLPASLPKLAVEAAQPDLWRKYVGLDGGVIGMHGFGESAPAAELYTHFGITSGAIVKAIVRLVQQ